MVALKQGSVPDVIANKLDHLLILTSGTEQYLITCTNKKYKFLLTTTLTISDTPDSPLDYHTFSVAFYSIDGSTADTLYNSNVVNRSIVSPVKENNISCHRGITSVPEPALTFKPSDTVRTKGKFRNDSTTSISHLIFSNYHVFW